VVTASSTSSAVPDVSEPPACTWSLIISWKAGKDGKRHVSFRLPLASVLQDIQRRRAHHLWPFAPQPRGPRYTTTASISSSSSSSPMITTRTLTQTPTIATPPASAATPSLFPPSTSDRWYSLVDQTPGNLRMRIRQTMSVRDIYRIIEQEAVLSPESAYPRLLAAAFVPTTAPPMATRHLQPAIGSSFRAGSEIEATTMTTSLLQSVDAPVPASGGSWNPTPRSPVLTPYWRPVADSSPSPSALPSPMPTPGASALPSPVASPFKSKGKKKAQEKWRSQDTSNVSSPALFAHEVSLALGSPLTIGGKDTHTSMSRQSATNLNLDPVSPMMPRTVAIPTSPPIHDPRMQWTARALSSTSRASAVPGGSTPPAASLSSPSPILAPHDRHDLRDPRNFRDPALPEVIGDVDVDRGTGNGEGSSDFPTWANTHARARTENNEISSAGSARSSSIGNASQTRRTLSVAARTATAATTWKGGAIPGTGVSLRGGWDKESLCCVLGVMLKLEADLIVAVEDEWYKNFDGLNGFGQVGLTP
jgi:hypothetical protein